MSDKTHEEAKDDWEGEGGAIPDPNQETEAFEHAKLAWEELAKVWRLGDQRTPEGRRALQGLKDALEALQDFMNEAGSSANIQARER